MPLQACRKPDAIIVVEVALALVLTVGAALLIRSYDAVRAVDPGIRIDRVLTMAMPLPFSRDKDAAARRAVINDALARVGSLKGVTAVATTDNLPLSGASIFYFITVGGVAPPAPGQPLFQADTRTVSAAYFAALGIPLVKGRPFDEYDTATSEPVAIVNESFVRRYFPGTDPIGRTVKRLMNDEPDRRIVGVVKDVHHHGLDRPTPIEMYLTMPQAPPFGVTLVAKTEGDPAAMVAAIKGRLHEADPRQPIVRIRTLADLLSRSLADRRFQAMVLGLFAGAAVLLALVGVHGLLEFSVRERTRELGVRVALGARPRDVLRLVLAQGMLPVGGGLALGLAGAWWATRLLTALLFGVTPGDWRSFALAVLLLMISAMAACVLPPRRAASVDPLVALRAE